MRITGVDCFGYTIAYSHGEYVMSGGRAARTQAGTLLRLRTDEGHEGWGESTPLGATYLPTHPEGIRAALQFLAPHLLQLDPTNISAVNERMDSVLLGHPYAKSAVDIACWDLFGKALGRPVAALLGGVLQDDFALYEAVPLGRPDEMASFVEARTAAGIGRFQLKVGNDPLEDVARASACVAAAKDDAIVVADANGGWNLYEARLAVNAMGRLPVLVEQPCRTTADCVLATAGSPLPLVLDESVSTLDDVYQAKHAAGASSVNLKLSRLGGITKTALLRDVLQGLDMKVSIEDMWGGDVVTAAVSHLAASTSPDHLFMVSFFNDWTDGHVAGHEPRSSAGRGSVPVGAGLGIVVDPSGLVPVFELSGEHAARL